MSIQDLINSSNIPLIKEYFIKNPEEIKETIFQDILNYHSFEIIKLLLELGANPNIRLLNTRN